MDQVRWLWLVAGVPVSVAAGAVLGGALAPFFCPDALCDSGSEVLAHAVMGASFGALVLLPMLAVAIWKGLWPVFARVMGFGLGMVILPLVVYPLPGLSDLLVGSVVATAAVIVIAGTVGSSLGDLVIVAVGRRVSSAV